MGIINSLHFVNNSSNNSRGKNGTPEFPLHMQTCNMVLQWDWCCIVSCSSQVTFVLMSGSLTASTLRLNGCVSEP